MASSDAQNPHLPARQATPEPAANDYFQVVLGNPETIARELADSIRQRGFTNLFPQPNKNGQPQPPREVPSYEGWKYACARLGLGICNRTITETSTGERRSFIAYAELVHLATGQVVTSGNGSCSSKEYGKSAKSDDDLMSMAQTRAGRKACTNALGWIMKIGGLGDDDYEPAAQPTTVTPQRPQTGSPRHNPNAGLPKPEVPEPTLPPLPEDHSLPAVEWQLTDLKRLADKPHCPLDVREGIHKEVATGKMTIGRALALRKKALDRLDEVGVPVASS
jgi:hypothetical protein